MLDYFCYDRSMISRIEGNIALVTEKFIVIDVSGVGYKVNVSPEVIVKSKKGSRVSFWTHLAVRENALDLYGFETIDELNFFEMLIDISGIGPKSALGIIGTESIDTLKKAIASGDTSYLTKVSGIGKKTAEKIIIELRDKLVAHKEEAGGTTLRTESDALEALKSLGYSNSEAREALRKVSSEKIDTSARVKEALKILGKN